MLPRWSARLLHVQLRQAAPTARQAVSCQLQRPPARPPELSPSGSKTFFDIGCNKGYTSAKFFGLWAPEVGFNPQAIRTKRPDVWCGNWCVVARGKGARADKQEQPSNSQHRTACGASPRANHSCGGAAPPGPPARLPRPPRSADCNEQLSPQVPASTGDVVVYCFEPSQANFAQLILTRDMFFKDNKPEVQW